MTPVLNMVGLEIRQDCEYASLTRGSEYASTSLNMP